MTIEETKEALIDTIYRCNSLSDYVGVKTTSESYKLLCEAELMTLSGKQLEITIEHILKEQRGQDPYDKNMQMLERATTGRKP